MTSRKRILITGGAGFIGSHVADKYVHDHEVMILDDLRTGYTENIPDGVWLQRIDVNDRRRLRDAFRAFKPHLVSHHAAQLEISKGYENPVEEAEEDLLATIRVLEESRRAGVQHFVYASSACCYAPDGSRELDPQWTYGAAKLAGEHYAQIYSRYMCMTVFRYGIVFGPREWYGRVLTNFVTRLLEHEPPVVFGDGTARRDFAYVLDAAEMHRTVTDMAASGVFDVGSGISTSVLDLAKALTTFARRKRLQGHLTRYGLTPGTPQRRYSREGSPHSCPAGCVCRTKWRTCLSYRILYWGVPEGYSANQRSNRTSNTLQATQSNGSQGVTEYDLRSHRCRNGDHNGLLQSRKRVL